MPESNFCDFKLYMRTIDATVSCLRSIIAWSGKEVPDVSQLVEARITLSIV